jgi:hypothetical protein
MSCKFCLVRAGFAGIVLATAFCVSSVSQTFFFPSQGTGWSSWNGGESAPRLADEWRRRAALDADDEKLLQCLTAKEEIAKDLIAGRIGLAEAVARFRATDANHPPRLRHLLPPGDSAEERWARSVLLWVASILDNHPGKEVVLSRLARERNEYLAATCPSSPAG